MAELLDRRRALYLVPNREHLAQYVGRTPSFYSP